MSCSRTQEFLAANSLLAAETVEAKKVVLKIEDALALAAGADDIYIAKGKKVVHFSMKEDKPDLAVLAEAMLGPTGNLRAPTLKVGKTLIVGFDQETYRRVLKT